MSSAEVVICGAGLAGISGVSSDMREITKEAAENNTNAKLTLDIFCYRLKKYIASYAAVMNGVDGLIFTAGIGENSPEVRALTCDKMDFLGIQLDEAKNRQAIAKEMVISAPDARVKVLVVPTNEELVIARDTLRLVQDRKG